MRVAGLLPPVPENREQEEKLLHLFRQLSSSRKQAAIDSLRGLAGKVAPGSNSQSQEVTSAPITDNDNDAVLMQMFDVLAKMASPEQMDQVADMLQQMQRQRLGNDEVYYHDATRKVGTIIHEPATSVRGGD